MSQDTVKAKDFSKLPKGQILPYKWNIDKWVTVIIDGHEIRVDSDDADFDQAIQLALFIADLPDLIRRSEALSWYMNPEKMGQ